VVRAEETSLFTSPTTENQCPFGLDFPFGQDSRQFEDNTRSGCVIVRSVADVSGTHPDVIQVSADHHVLFLQLRVCTFDLREHISPRVIAVLLVIPHRNIVPFGCSDDACRSRLDSLALDFSPRMVNLPLQALRGELFISLHDLTEYAFTNGQTQKTPLDLQRRFPRCPRRRGPTRATVGRLVRIEQEHDRRSLVVGCLHLGQIGRLFLPLFHFFFFFLAFFLTVKHLSQARSILGRAFQHQHDLVSNVHALILVQAFLWSADPISNENNFRAMCRAWRRSRLDREERGLLGSNHFAKEPCDGVTIDQIVAHFNLDMVGMGEALNASGALNFPSVWDVIRRGQEPEIMKRLKPREGGPGGSDHSAFIVRGIETMMLISSGGVGHQDYHQPEDDSSKIEPEMLRTAGQFALQSMLNLANETKVNLLVDRRQQIYRALRMRIKNLNPDLSGSLWSRVNLEADSSQALRDKIHNQSRELARGVSSAKPPKRTLSRGLPGPGLICDDFRLLELVIDFYGIGRLDIEKDDGTWVVDGRLTDTGREGLKTLESNGIMVRLISPSADLIGDFLSAATKPFVITGDFQLTYALAERLGRAGVQLGIDLDPKKAGDFLSRAEHLKGELGERKNLFAYLTATEGLEASRKPLYLGLVDRGWAHNEICGSRDHGGLIGGANLDRLYKEGTQQP